MNPEVPPISSLTECTILFSGYVCYMLEYSGSPSQTCLSMADQGALSLFQCSQQASGFQPGPAVTYNIPYTLTVTNSQNLESVSTVSSALTTESFRTSVPVTTYPTGVNDGRTSLTTSYDGLQSVTTDFSVLTTESSQSYYPETFTETITEVSLYAPLIQLNWKASDSPPERAAPTTSSVTSPTASQSNNSPSTNAKIAIGVVVPLVVLVAGALSIMAFLRRTQRRSRNIATAEYGKPELDASNTVSATSKNDQQHEMSAWETPRELSPEVRHELAVPEVVHEMDASDRESDTGDK